MDCHMSARRQLQLALLALSVSGAGGIAAQPPTARFDTAAARTYTLGALVEASRNAVRLTRGDPANAALVARVERLLGRVDRPEVARLPLDVLVRSQPRQGDTRAASFGRVARWQRRAVVPGLGAGDAADLDSLARLTVAELKFAMEGGTPPVSDDSVDIILTPYTALQRGELQASIATSLEKLNRFERKYGPEAPRLNLAEVGLNYVAQWVPLLRPNGDGWPSRFELVTSYVPTYMTIVDEQARAVTVAELGLRSYLWQRGWGGAAGGILRPGYLSFGVAVAGERDGAFVSPMQGKARIGGFFGWGESKIAVLGGSQRRLLVTRQMQLMPWFF